jgi:hypothetical protein
MSAELDALKATMVAAVGAYSDKFAAEKADRLARAKALTGEESQEAVHEGLVSGMKALLKVDNAVTSTPTAKWREYVIGAGAVLLVAVGGAAVLFWKHIFG